MSNHVIPVTISHGERAAHLGDLVFEPDNALDPDLGVPATAVAPGTTGPEPNPRTASAAPTRPAPHAPPSAELKMEFFLRLTITTSHQM